MESKTMSRKMMIKARRRRRPKQLVDDG